MRKIPIIGFVALSLSLSCSTLGQGSFLFQNYYTSSGVDAPVFDAQGVPLAGNDFLAELYGGIAADSLAPATPYTAVPFLTGIGAGYFQAAYYVLIPNVPGGTYVWLRVRAWDARLGATYGEVVALGRGGYGESPLFYALGGNPASTFGPQPLIGLQSFSLLPVVPEPSTWALLALGGTVLVWRSRGRPRGRS